MERHQVCKALLLPNNRFFVLNTRYLTAHFLWRKGSNALHVFIGSFLGKHKKQVVGGSGDYVAQQTNRQALQTEAQTLSTESTCIQRQRMGSHRLAVKLSGILFDTEDWSHVMVSPNVYQSLLGYFAASIISRPSLTMKCIHQFSFPHAFE